MLKEEANYRKTIWYTIIITFRNNKWCHMLFMSTYVGKSIKAWGLPCGQWLRCCAPSAGGSGSIPGQGTRSHMSQLKMQRSCMPTSTQHSKINKFLKKMHRGLPGNDKPQIQDSGYFWGAEKDQNQECYIENFSCSHKYTFYLSEWCLL